MITRCFGIHCLVWALALCACSPPSQDDGGQAEPVASTEHPSILFVLIDTMRADHTSLIGHRSGRTTTPFLDSLADESFVFDRAYAAASWTRASMASIFSSRVPSGHGCETRYGVMAENIETWTEALDDAGYDTRAVITNGNVLAQHGFDQGFDGFERHTDYLRNAYADVTKLTEPALRAVDQAGAGPNFIYLHYVDPHDPFQEHPENDFNPTYAGTMSGSRDALEPYRWAAPVNDEDRQRVIDLYDGEILWFDGHMRRLFDKLEQRGVLNDSWIVFTSDHGEGLWDHRIQAHGQEVFEEQIHVPLFIRPPGGLDARVDVDMPISLIDLAPTMLDLVNVPAPLSFAGRSWAPWMRNEGEAPVRPVIVDEKLDDVHLAAIIDGHEKLILNFVRPEEGYGPAEGSPLRSALYFDLLTNPTEDLSLAVDVRRKRHPSGVRLHQDLVRRLTAAEESRQALGEIRVAEESEELLEELKRMGYFGDAMPAADSSHASEPTDDSR
ncbi:MAG: arylsulfatase A-like enzyme [Pseudohongiellaceae bacterium]